MQSHTLTANQHRAIDLAKEGLVQAAEKLLEDVQVKDIPRRNLGDSQLRNLMAVANETESPAVICNFLRYQVGRDPKGNNWGKNIYGQKLGDHFIQQLEGEQGAITRALKDAGLQDLEGVQRQLARMTLIRHFLGFASRYLKYLDPQRSASERHH